jgi:hypothetical protein
MGSIFNNPSPAQVFCSFGGLPHIATTAVTATLGRITRAIRICFQILFMLKTEVATPCTMRAISGMFSMKLALTAFKLKNLHAKHQKL